MKFNLEDDKRLVARCLGPKSADYEDAWLELTKRCLPILRAIYGMYVKKFFDPMYDFEDFAQMVFIRLTTSLKMWDPSRGSLNTYIRLEGRTYLFMIFEHERHKGRDLIAHLGTPLPDEKDVQENAVSEDPFEQLLIDEERLNKVISRLPLRHQETLKAYARGDILMKDAGEAVYAARLVAKDLGMISDLVNPGKKHEK